MKSSVLVIDGDNVFRRFWHANPESAMENWSKLLSSYHQRTGIPSSHLAVVFDGEDTRDHGVEGYKAQRKEPDPVLVRDLLRAEKTASRFGEVIKIDGDEGDQIISGVVKWSVTSGFNTWVLSSDKDMLQLVSDSTPPVVVVRPLPSGYQRYTEATVRRVFGVSPKQIASFLTLVGDSSDNLKGVRGIGNKGAIYLLSKFKNLSDIFERLDQVELKYRLLLEASQDLVLPTYKLVKLRHPAIPLKLQTVRPKNRLAASL